MKKRLIILILAAVMAFGCVSVASASAGGVQYLNETFNNRLMQTITSKSAQGEMNMISRPDAGFIPDMTFETYALIALPTPLAVPIYKDADNTEYAMVAPFTNYWYQEGLGNLIDWAWSWVGEKDFPYLQTTAVLVPITSDNFQEYLSVLDYPKSNLPILLLEPHNACTFISDDKMGVKSSSTNFNFNFDMSQAKNDPAKILDNIKVGVGIVAIINQSGTKYFLLATEDYDRFGFTYDYNSLGAVYMPDPDLTYMSDTDETSAKKVSIVMILNDEKYDAAVSDISNKLHSEIK